jgi:hypothetical protein
VQLHYKDTFICVYLQTRRRHGIAQSRRAAFQLRLLHVAAVHADGPNVIVVLSHILMCVHWGHAAVLQARVGLPKEAAQLLPIRVEIHLAHSLVALLRQLVH